MNVKCNLNDFQIYRPINAAEQKKNAVPVLNLRKNEVVVRQDNNVKQFAYDHVSEFPLTFSCLAWLKSKGRKTIGHLLTNWEIKITVDRLLFFMRIEIT